MKVLTIKRPWRFYAQKLQFCDKNQHKTCENVKNKTNTFAKV